MNEKLETNISGTIIHQSSICPLFTKLIFTEHQLISKVKPEEGMEAGQMRNKWIKERPGRNTKLL
jgi:hypothetical protein